MRRRSLAAAARATLTGFALTLAGCASAPADSPAASPNGSGDAPASSWGAPSVPAGAPSGAPAGTSPGGSSGPIAPSGAPAAREIVVDIRDGVVSPPPADVEVSVGERLRVVVTSDAPDEVHVHGVDVTGPVGPATPFDASVVPTQTGVFEVELHESGALLFQLLVR